MESWELRHNEGSTFMHKDKLGEILFAQEKKGELMTILKNAADSSRVKMEMYSSAIQASSQEQRWVYKSYC